MSRPSQPKATEARLEEIRNAAAHGGKLAVSAAESYYGLPVLKPPVWTWEIPLYFFFGGIAGVSSCIGLVAQLFRADPSLVRHCFWIALAGAAICPALLVADLGRPGRFLNMLRVFKLRSPMSMGAWILVAFSACQFLAVLGIELARRGFANPLSSALLWVGAASGAVTGLLLASYTGVLIGATAIPVWSENRKLLPTHFLASGLGGAAAILELCGFLIRATQILGFVAAGAETVIGIILELRPKPADAPLYRGGSGWMLRAAGFVEGPAALLLRVFAGASPAGRYAAALCFLAGSFANRFGWIWAGRVSARDPQALLGLERKT